MQERAPVFDMPEFSGKQLSLELTQNEWRLQARRPPGSDPVIGALSRALLAQPNDSSLIKEIEDAIEHRNQADPDTSPSEFAGVVRASIFSYFLYRKNGLEPDSLQKRQLPLKNDNEFPYISLVTPEAWQPYLDTISASIGNNKNDSDAARLQFDYDLTVRKVQTNIPQRYTSVELLMQATRRRFPNGVRWLDIGSSMMLGPKQLNNKADFPLNTEAIYATKVDAYRQQADPELTTKVRRLLNQPSILRETVCTDIANICFSDSNEYIPGNKEWGRSSNRPLKELANKDLMATYDRILDTQPANFHFQQVDFEDPEDVQSLLNKHAAKELFDMITLLHAWHQFTPEVKRKIMEIVPAMLSDNGLLLLQDFFYLPHTSKTPRPVKSLKDYRNWYRDINRCRTVVYDPKVQPSGFQEAMHHSDGRCNSSTLAKAELWVPGGTQKLGQLVLAA